MANLSLIEIRKKLPHGAITKIAGKCGVEPKIVSEVLNRGWHPGIRNKVINYSIDEIEAMYPDEKLMERLKVVDLDKEDIFAVPVRKRKKNNPPALTYEDLDAECEEIQELLDEAEGEDEEYYQELLQQTEDKRDSLRNPDNPGLFSGRNLIVTFGIVALILFALIPQLRNWIFSRLGIKDVKTV